MRYPKDSCLSRTKDAFWAEEISDNFYFGYSIERAQRVVQDDNIGEIIKKTGECLDTL